MNRRCDLYRVLSRLLFSVLTDDNVLSVVMSTFSDDTTLEGLIQNSDESVTFSDDTTLEGLIQNSAESVKFSDDTTLEGLIQNSDESAYRE